MMTAPAGRTALFPIGPTDPLRFAADSPERDATAKALDTARNTAFDVPNLIGDREVRTGVTAPVVTPHEHKRQLGTVHYAGPAEAHQAIDEALRVSQWWGRLPWEERVEPFLRAADMLQYGPWR